MKTSLHWKMKAHAHIQGTALLNWPKQNWRTTL